eukprot:CAMPEP_0206367652 /NCGR_PEP_ID=MMETSP0294-20121207/4194_1 /ASSEMBLY_ACC=CAM_ASM_000327 /TAXON_ID=39354 /ORGANISM="Heterosigma akashiwo, Strain CCMP2393" /LENGTH=140 /DNA_ID=CAMNT_0053813987 /DNA_START=29 /DNA_END=451 /DNA_ORIENTATION=-
MECIGEIVPDLKLMKLEEDKDEETAEETSLLSLLAGKPTIVDFWSTFCKKCPAALTKLNELSQAHPEINFVAINIDDYEGSWNMISEREEWQHITHVYAEDDQKEIAMEKVGLKFLPYYLVLSEVRQQPVPNPFHVVYSV